MTVTVSPSPARRRVRFRRAALPLAALALAAAASACASTGTPESTGQGSPVPPATAAPAPGGATLPGGVTAPVAQKLCDSLESQLQSMRTYTLTPGKITLNGVVATWAAQNGINVVDLATHKDRVDAITEAQCPQVRTDVTKALEIPDLASGLLGI